MRVGILIVAVAFAVTAVGLGGVILFVGSNGDLPGGGTDDQWSDGPIVVAVEPGDEDRDYPALVREAVAYWEGDAGGSYLDDEVRFEVAPSVEDPDVVVRFVDEIDGCDHSDDPAGCAPRIEDPAAVERPVTVEVETGLSREGTLLVLRHEFGHVLGLGHDDEPQSVMAERQEVSPRDQPDVGERDIPWEDWTLAYHVSVEAGDEPAVREQVGHAIDYYERGADGAAATEVTLVSTDDPEEAEVLIRVVDRDVCEPDPGSCLDRTGVDTDGDGDPEYYDRLTITVEAVPTDTVGWHVGYWLGYAFGFTEESDWPAPFRDASPEDRRGEWWQTSGRLVAP